MQGKRLGPREPAHQGGDLDAPAARAEGSPLGFVTVTEVETSKDLRDREGLRLRAGRRAAVDGLAGGPGQRPRLRPQLAAPAPRPAGHARSSTSGPTARWSTPPASSRCSSRSGSGAADAKPRPQPPAVESRPRPSRPPGRALMLGHVHPDADVLGTLLALGLALRRRGWRSWRRAASGARRARLSCPASSATRLTGRGRPSTSPSDRLSQPRAHRGAHRPGAAAPGRRQHRPPPRQPALRRRQLGRRRGRRHRRDGLPAAHGARRADHAGDRDQPLHGDPHRHRLVPLLQRDARTFRIAGRPRRRRRRAGRRSPIALRAARADALRWLGEALARVEISPTARSAGSRCRPGSFRSRSSRPRSS